MTATAGPIDVGELIDGGRWGGYQRWLVFLTALTIVFDGIDNQLMGVTIPTIMREWSVARSAFAPVVSLGYLGMVTGGALAGLLGDRIGRRVTLIASMIVFGGMTLAVAGAGSVAALAVLRFLAGLGLGGAVPNAAALAAEYVPTAPESFPTRRPSSARSTRVRSRSSSNAHPASFSPSVVGSACTPCVRPIVSVIRCSTARRTTAVKARSMPSTISRPASWICSESAVSRTSEDVSP